MTKLLTVWKQVLIAIHWVYVLVIRYKIDNY